MHIKLYIAIFCLCYVSVYLAVGVNIDSSGYILYCPCMGRFGNQADHFLGALGFAKGLNRTLALPPWVEYRYGEAKSRQVPFDTYFQVEPLEEFHRVITMEAFMEGVAPTLWPPEKRISFCYMSRGKPEGCAAKEGNPFGPFWDTFSVDFTGSEFYAPLHYDVHHHDMGTMWNEKYSPEEWPVLAFTGAPASFPVQDENRGLHKHLVWSKEVEKRAKEFIKTVLPKGSFVGIHLRNGVDWVRACEHVKDATNFFSSPQCLGYRNEHGKPTKEMCFPSLGTITKLLKRVVKQIKAVAVFVASDNNYMITELETALKRMEVSVHKYEPANPHVELAILGQANHFIGNCISSFSAFAKRERDVRGFPSSFWDFPPEKLNKSKESKIVHDEF